MSETDLTQWPLDSLAQWTGNADAGSTSHTRGMAELTRRQLLSSIKATDAQNRAAIAAAANAKYMLASVIVAAVAALFSAASAIAALYTLWPKKAG